MKFKIPRPGVGGKEGAKDIPSWAMRERPLVGEPGRVFAARLLDAKYGRGNYGTGPRTEFHRLKKWADRAFEDPD